MQENHPNTGARSGTQHWSPEERALLARLAPRKPRRAELAALFPGRTLAAVKKQLSEERKRQGIGHAPQIAAFQRRRTVPMLHPNDPGMEDGWQAGWSRKAADSNAAFLNAFHRAADRAAA